MLSSNLKILKTAQPPSKVPTKHSISPQLSHCQNLIFRMFGRTIRLEPATGSRKTAGGGYGDRRQDRFVENEFRPPRRANQETGGYREYSTLRPAVPGFLAARRPVALTQVNALVGRRMFGLAASVVLRRRVV